MNTPLPSAGDTTWMDWAGEIHDEVNNLGGGVNAGLPGDSIPQPGPVIFGQGGRTMGTRVYLHRYVPSKPRTLTLAAFNVTTAGTGTDSVEVAIYTAGTTLTRVATTGSVTGFAGTVGVKTAALSYTLTAGTVYYVAVGSAVSGGVWAINAAVAQTGDSWLVYGNTQPNACAGFSDAMFSGGLLPATYAASSVTWGGVGNYPSLVLRTA